MYARSYASHRMPAHVLALAVALVLAACAGGLPPPAVPAEPPAAASQTSPTATRRSASGLTSSGTDGKPQTGTLTVFAAASLTEAFGELGQQFEAANPGAHVIFNFAGSQQLLAQLQQGAGADVFAPASNQEMQAMLDAGLVITGTPRSFARNRLVVIYPRDNPGRVQTLADLGRPGLKLDVADKSVPVGRYTLAMLDRLSQDPAYGPAFHARALQNVVSYENDVKAVASKVGLAEADAGVVYATDVTPALAPKVSVLQIPDRYNQTAVYPIAALARAAQPELARRFIELALSDAGQQTLAKHGFATK